MMLEIRPGWRSMGHHVMIPAPSVPIPIGPEEYCASAMAYVGTANERRIIVFRTSDETLAAKLWEIVSRNDSTALFHPPTK